jgi:hypothetical protein|mmetsp:Transcript_62789/g.103582  ORF Transcript_62789/g.103582 Transcript_62789/m.103582 type:complete len:228 (-) Transcript_62789:102-785(-)
MLSFCPSRARLAGWGHRRCCHGALHRATLHAILHTVAHRTPIHTEYCDRTIPALWYPWDMGGERNLQERVVQQESTLNPDLKLSSFSPEAQQRDRLCPSPVKDGPGSACRPFCLCKQHLVHALIGGDGNNRLHCQHGVKMTFGTHCVGMGGAPEGSLEGGWNGWQNRLMAKKCHETSHLISSAPLLQAAMAWELPCRLQRVAVEGTYLCCVMQTQCVFKTCPLKDKT